MEDIGVRGRIVLLGLLPGWSCGDGNKGFDPNQAGEPNQPPGAVQSACNSRILRQCACLL